MVRGTFGEAIIYTPASTGIPEPITAQFDVAAQVIEMQGAEAIVGLAPVIDVLLADLSVMPKGRAVGSSATPDRVTVRGQDYAVIKVETSGAGAARCVLAKV
jgi:hypothetical protein